MNSNRVASRLREVAASNALALAMIVLAAILDYLGGPELHIEPIYLLPVGVAAWYGGLTSAALLAAVATAACQLANDATGPLTAPVGIRMTNLGIQLGFATAAGLFACYLKQRFTIVEWTSRHDALTGLPNARAFHERADEELARAKRHGKPLTAAYIDLDNFKLLNDLHGHRAGDAALRMVAKLLRRSARASDVTARLGGDEFVVLMPETDAEGARAVLERLRAELDRSLASCSDSLSASIGAVSFVELPETVEQLLSAADDRMYAVKRATKAVRIRA